MEQSNSKYNASRLLILIHYSFGAVTRIRTTIMELLRLKKRRHSHEIVIKRQLEKLEYSVNDVSHFYHDSCDSGQEIEIVGGYKRGDTF